MALTLVSSSAARSPRHCDWLHTALWVPTEQLSQYTLPFRTCLCKVDNITQITRNAAFVIRTDNHRSGQRATGEDHPRPDSPVCELMWRYVLHKLITRGMNVQNNFLKISELVSLLSYYEIFTITINTLLMICIQHGQHVVKKCWSPSGTSRFGSSYYHSCNKIHIWS